MTDSPTLVLLPGFRDPGHAWAPVLTALSDNVTVLAPAVPGLTSRDEFTLEGSAAGVASALDGPAVVCGVGLGAMVALQLAVDHPGRVDGLVLITRQVRSSSLLLSLPAAVLPLVPTTWVARLGAQQDQILTLLDQVRPVDFTSLARQVSAPALVLCGSRDVINRRTSANLARALPHGDLQTVRDAGPGWWRESPQQLVDALRARLLG